MAQNQSAWRDDDDDDDDDLHFDNFTILHFDFYNCE